MKTLHLTLKRKWFDMIASGEKTEEYREIKPYWITRLIDWSDYPMESPDDCKNIAQDICYDITVNGHDPMEVLKGYFANLKEFDTVHFQNGYSEDADEFNCKCLGIEIREGKPEWGAEPGVKYFVIKLQNC